MLNQTCLDDGRALNEFHNLIILHLPLLMKQAMALTRNKADAEDLVQAAVASAIAARASFTVGTNFKAWMTCVLRNRFLTNIRQRRFHVDLDEVPDGLLGRSGGQDDHLEIAELRRQMARLPADHQIILIMITIDGVSYDEASQTLGVAVGTLKCRVFRARAQLEVWMHGKEQSITSMHPPANRRGTGTPNYTSSATARINRNIEASALRR